MSHAAFQDAFLQVQDRTLELGFIRLMEYTIIYKQ